jgi:hypothetical protein
VSDTAIADYDQWFASEFNAPGWRRPGVWPLSTFPQDTPWGYEVALGMDRGERLYADKLIGDLEADGVPGDVIEFGVYGGSWLLVLIESLERRGSTRGVWGLDSFKGLPKPSEHDPDCWKEGDYYAPLEQVRNALSADARPQLTLVEGWFKDTLPTPKMQAIKQIAYARIDCDLYEPALECLDWLAPRLVHGGVLVFDDWQFDINTGEVLAYREWKPKHPEIKLEFLAMNLWAHTYFRVLRV